MESLFKDIHYGIRGLLKRPGFTAIAVITLALGIGANTAIFSVVNTILLRPLPFHDPEQLVTLWERNPKQGIRMALGAQVGDVRKLVIKNGMTLALIGVAIGLAGAYGLTRLMASLLFGISATDAPTFTTISAELVAVALIACYIPARRATKVDPLVALRYE
ncbi:hypothetical protein BH20ACI3_BH20ACI3_33980 [soil metagenome]